MIEFCHFDQLAPHFADGRRRFPVVHNVLHSA